MSVSGKKKTPDIVAKWGDEIAERGFAQVPNYLLLINQFLEDDKRLSPIELLLLVELVGTWWKASELPFPSMKTLAVRCGVSERQVQRSVAHLEAQGYFKRHKRRSKGAIASNAYDLRPLVDLLKSIAEEYPNQFVRKIK